MWVVADFLFVGLSSTSSFVGRLPAFEFCGSVEYNIVRGGLPF